MSRFAFGHLESWPVARPLTVSGGLHRVEERCGAGPGAGRTPTFRSWRFCEKVPWTRPRTSQSGPWGHRRRRSVGASGPSSRLLQWVTMSPTTSSPNEIVRRAFLRIDSSSVLACVDSLDLRGHGKVSAVVGLPLRTLQQRREVATFAATAPMAALRGLLELLATKPLGLVIESLGEHADSPTFDQLSATVDELLASGTSNDDLVALLAYAIIEQFPASAHCRRLLSERPDFQLPELPDVTAVPTLLVPKTTDPRVREERRARREQEKQRKKRPGTPRPSHSGKAPRVKGAPPSRTPTEVPGTGGAPNERRRPLLTPAESERFDVDHPLAGSVVVADVAYDAVDPMTPEVRSKERPVLVVAANDDALLVRAIYSSPAPARRVFLAWRRLGLDHVSYIDDARVALVASGSSLARLGVLNVVEWNALL